MALICPFPNSILCCNATHLSYHASLQCVLSPKVWFRSLTNKNALLLKWYSVTTSQSTGLSILRSLSVNCNHPHGWIIAQNSYQLDNPFYLAEGLFGEGSWMDIQRVNCSTDCGFLFEEKQQKYKIQVTVGSPECLCLRSFTCVAPCVHKDTTGKVTDTLSSLSLFCF